MISHTKMCSSQITYIALRSLIPIIQIYLHLHIETMQRLDLVANPSFSESTPESEDKILHHN